MGANEEDCCHRQYTKAKKEIEKEQEIADASDRNDPQMCSVLSRTL